MREIQGKLADLTLKDSDTLCRIAHALSSPARVEIMRILSRNSMNIGEIAQALDLPMSSAALNVRILKEAGLIHVENLPGVRGTVRLCSRKLDRVTMNLVSEEDIPDASVTLAMPIGGYSLAENISGTCGMLSSTGTIGVMDSPAIFYLPDRFQAQLLWFRRGFLEYRFSVPEPSGQMQVRWLELSFEACSEAPMYRNPWQSDIAVEINGVRLGTWTSPCDCGGRRGSLTPGWWDTDFTQFGFLKTWYVDEEGTFLDCEKISDVTPRDLKVDPEKCIVVRIGVPEDSVHAGGMNLFGEQFGNYPQALRLRLGFAFREPPRLTEQAGDRPFSSGKE